MNFFQWISDYSRLSFPGHEATAWSGQVLKRNGELLCRNWGASGYPLIMVTRNTSRAAAFVAGQDPCRATAPLISDCNPLDTAPSIGI
jgi:hypothetical protein